VEIISLDVNDVNRFEAGIEEAVRFLREGKTIVYPTDTVYGIGCDALNSKAVLQVAKIKKVKDGKPVSVLVRDLEEIKKYSFLGNTNKRILEKLLPGKFTFILPGAKNIPVEITGGGKNIGFRIPEHPVTQKMTEFFENPIVTTSANISGEDPLSDPFKIVERFRDEKYQPDLVLDFGKIESAHPSVVVDISTTKPRILRSGMMNVQETLELLTKLSSI
jgi:tRNA threonylcarbamoyl adenosine modification protein (Sua5/YciO/YrdC/YwlC family)